MGSCPPRATNLVGRVPAKAKQTGKNSIKAKSATTSSNSTNRKARSPDVKLVSVTRRSNPRSARAGQRRQKVPKPGRVAAPAVTRTVLKWINSNPGRSSIDCARSLRALPPQLTSAIVDYIVAIEAAKKITPNRGTTDQAMDPSQSHLLRVRAIVQWGESHPKSSATDCVADLKAQGFAGVSGDLVSPPFRVRGRRAPMEHLGFRECRRCLWSWLRRSSPLNPLSPIRTRSVVDAGRRVWDGRIRARLTYRGFTTASVQDRHCEMYA